METPLWLLQNYLCITLYFCFVCPTWCDAEKCKLLYFRKIKIWWGNCLWSLPSVLLQESSSGGCCQKEDWIWKKGIEHCWTTPGREHYWGVPSELCRCCKFSYCSVFLCSDLTYLTSWNDLLQFKIDKPFIPSHQLWWWLPYFQGLCGENMP